MELRILLLAMLLNKMSRAFTCRGKGDVVIDKGAIKGRS